MRCPKCKSYHIGVIKTTKLEKEKLRLRVCYDCRYVFETIEKILDNNLQKRQEDSLNKKN